jgi:hypothetical protein
MKTTGAQQDWVIDARHTTTSTRLTSPCKSLCVSYFRLELMHQVERNIGAQFFLGWTAGLYLEWRACTGIYLGENLQGLFWGTGFQDLQRFLLYQTSQTVVNRFLNSSVKPRGSNRS